MILFFYVDTLKFYFVGVYMSFLLLLVLQRFVFIRLPGNLAFFWGVWFFFFLRLYLRLIMQYLLVIIGDGRATERRWEISKCIRSKYTYPRNIKSLPLGHLDRRLDPTGGTLQPRPSRASQRHPCCLSTRSSAVRPHYRHSSPSARQAQSRPRSAGDLPEVLHPVGARDPDR